MHYVRHLRPPKLTGSGTKRKLELVLTVTTDLGDSFYQPERDGISLNATVTTGDDEDAPSFKISPSSPRDLKWTAQSRVAKPIFTLKPVICQAISSGEVVRLCIGVRGYDTADSAGRTLSRSGGLMEGEAIVPVWTVISESSTGGTPVCTRRIEMLDDQLVTLEVEEEIGESIARHIWDAGLMAVCAVAECEKSEKGRNQNVQQFMQELLIDMKDLNVLELGCGVGILGLGFASIRRFGDGNGEEGRCSILMTDLPEAEERVRANIARSDATRSILGRGIGLDDWEKSPVEVLYENFDWEDGCKGRLPPLVRSRRWDLIIISDCTYNADMLSALVGTLDAVHEHNEDETEVFLAMKPRHPSEEIFFAIMGKSGWDIKIESRVPLTHSRNEDECVNVELYLFRKGAS